MSVDPKDIYSARLSNEEFTKLSEFIYRGYGIKMPPVKKVMLQSRLQKRLRALSMVSFSEYCNYVFSKEGEDEIIHMIDVVSTNKTDFFREPVHFEFLSNTVIPQICNSKNQRIHIKIWSAGCSSGEEPYTIAICLSELQQTYSNFDFSILATDISTDMLQRGANGIYREDRIEGIPLSFKKQYFLKSRDKTKQLVRLIPEIRQKVVFKRLNFMDTHYPIQDSFDIVFCRNALIYFERETQERVINKLCVHLKTDGYFFLGHSESITNMDVPLKHIKPTIFRKI